MSSVYPMSTAPPEGLLAASYLTGGSQSAIVQVDTGEQDFLALLRWMSVGSGGELTEWIVWFFERTGDSPVSRASSESVAARIETAAERIALIRSALSLNIRELARVLHVERPTVYSWISGVQPREVNARRLQALADLAREWNELKAQPLGDLRKETGEDGLSILERLGEDPLDLDRIRGLFKAAAKKLRARRNTGFDLAARALARGVVLAEPPDAQREIDRLTGKRIGPE